MFYKKFKLLFLFVLLGVLAFVLACSETEIPNTPEEPFLLSLINISSDLTPRPFTTLSVGQSLTFSFKVSYTLAPQEASNRGNLRLDVGFLGIDSNGNSFSVVNPFAVEQFSLTANKGSFPVSATIVIPATNPNTQLNAVTLDLVAIFFDTSTNTFSNIRDDITWTIQ
jgi:hypothetical protein